MENKEFRGCRFYTLTLTFYTLTAFDLKVGIQHSAHGRPSSISLAYSHSKGGGIVLGSRTQDIEVDIVRIDAAIRIHFLNYAQIMQFLSKG